ncbi:MAG: hypothetical protein ACFFD2_12555 [Promethearchaeota archaeon]
MKQNRVKTSPYHDFICTGPQCGYRGRRHFNSARVGALLLQQQGESPRYLYRRARTSGLGLSKFMDRIVPFIILTIIKIIERVFSLNFAIPIASFGIFYWAYIDWFYFFAISCGVWTFFIFLSYFTGNIIHGANANLSGIAISLAVGKYLT